jgi:L-ascorbate metabolism protein UlaG (beta-lactamase superfamily)
MKFKFIGNAGGIFTGSNGTKILCDPWIVDGVFEDAWYHYPPLKQNYLISKM